MRHRLSLLPTTPLGTRAAWLAAGFVAFQFAWSVLPGGALLAFGCGIAGGVTALVAITRRHERAVLAYAAVLPLLLVVLFVAAELLVGHD